MIKNAHRIPKDGNLPDYISLQFYQKQKPGIFNMYYQTNLLQIIDLLPQQIKKEPQQQLYRTNLNQAIQPQTQKNQLLNMSTNNTQVTLTNIVMSYKHESDQLGSDVKINQYQITKTMLGKGSHSFVKMAKKQGKLYAVKTISYDHLKKRIIIKDQQITRMINSEISMLIKLRSPNIIGFQQAIYLPEKQRVFIILEYCSKGTILKYMQSSTTVTFAEWQVKAKPIMKQIAQGILKMHENNIIHRDIKAENVLINEKDEIKIIDFNVSCEVPSDGKITITDKFIGTKTYAPPQLILPMTQPREVDGRLIDVWALGVTFIELLEKKHPFSVNTPAQLVKMLETPLEINKNFHPDLKDLLEKMMKFQNRERIQVNQILKHAWFQR